MVGELYLFLKMFLPFNLIFPFQGFYPKRAIRDAHIDLCT